MRIRFFLLTLVLLVCSCNKLNLKSSKLDSLDTIVDFTKIDVSPAFLPCDALEGLAKTKCFEKEIQRRVLTGLENYDLSVKETVDEEVVLIILISKKGKISLKEVEASEIIDNLFPNIDKVFKATISSLPKVTPALKQGFPVASQYKIPIRIKS